jgi:hypothetical protein
VRQLFEAVKPRCIDPAIQSSWNPAVSGEESQKATDGANVMLQTGPVEAFTGLVDVRFDILGLNRTERDPLRLKMVQKTRGRVSVGRDGLGRESVNFTQMIYILLDQDRLGGAFACFISAGSDPAGDCEISL